MKCELLKEINIKFCGENQQIVTSLLTNQNKQNFVGKLIIYVVIKIEGGRCHGNNLLSNILKILCFVAT